MKGFYGRSSQVAKSLRARESNLSHITFKIVGERENFFRAFIVEKYLTTHFREWYCVLPFEVDPLNDKSLQLTSTTLNYSYLCTYPVIRLVPTN